MNHAVRPVLFYIDFPIRKFEYWLAKTQRKTLQYAISFISADRNTCEEREVS